MKTRHELPVLKKLNIKFDINKLVESYEKFVKDTEWNDLSNEYISLCEKHSNLTKNFFREDELGNTDNICDMDWKNASYKQVSLTEFDNTFSLKERENCSNTIWDKRTIKNDPKADERWFRKLKSNIPDYLQQVFDTIQGAHRTRFALLAPGSSIKPHIDFDTAYSIRLHIAIKTNDKCTVGGWDRRGDLYETHIPADGSVWFLNPGIRHFAANKGNTNRIHLVVSAASQRLLD